MAMEEGDQAHDPAHQEEEEAGASGTGGGRFTGSGGRWNGSLLGWDNFDGW